MQDQPHNNILFLDFDGVLNTGTPSCRDEYGEVLDTTVLPETVAQVLRLFSI